MEELETLREKGIKLTPQRLIIYKKLKEMGGHLTVEDIYDVIKDEIPSISISTIYRTLKYFEEKGLIFSMPAFRDYGVTIFDSNEKPHHHFICKSCGGIWDIPQEGIKTEVKEKVPGTYEMVSVVIKGICDKCKKKGER